MRDTTITATQSEMTVAYLRSASVEQTGGSVRLSRQRRMCEGYARHHGLHIAAVYIDAGVSGMAYDRPGLNQLMRDLSRGRIRWVIVAELDVLRKNPELVLRLHQGVRRRGGRLVLASDVGMTPYFERGA